MIATFRRGELKHEREVEDGDDDKDNGDEEEEAAEKPSGRKGLYLQSL